MSTYVLGIEQTDSPFIKCACCGIVSYNQSDIEYLYCGNCKMFHTDPVTQEELLKRSEVMKEAKVDYLLSKMMQSDMALYEKIIDTTGFARYFSELVNLAKQP